MEFHQACKTKKRKPGYWAQDGKRIVEVEGDRASFVPRLVWIADVMSAKCRSDFDLLKVGPCKGCTQEVDYAYLEANGLYPPKVKNAKA